MDTSHTPVHLVIFDLSAFRNQLWAFYGRCGTWRAVADLGDFEALRAVSKAPPALLCKLAKETDYYPTDLEICKALNIPAPVLVLACPICGDPHTHTHDELPYTPATHALIALPAAPDINGSVPTQSKPRAPRLIAASDRPLYDWVKEHAKELDTTMAAVIRLAVQTYKNSHTPMTQEEFDYWYSDEFMALLEDNE